jgi:hypothetical protein
MYYIYHIYVCMYVCMYAKPPLPLSPPFYVYYVCMYVCIYVCMYVCMYIRKIKYMSKFQLPDFLKKRGFLRDRLVFLEEERQRLRALESHFQVCITIIGVVIVYMLYKCVYDTD